MGIIGPGHCGTASACPFKRLVLSQYFPLCAANVSEGPRMCSILVNDGIETYDSWRGYSIPYHPVSTCSRYSIASESLHPYSKLI